MPTSSIFHNFVITDKEAAEYFIEALEESKAEQAKHPIMKLSRFELKLNDPKLVELIKKICQKHSIKIERRKLIIRTTLIRF